MGFHIYFFAISIVSVFLFFLPPGAWSDEVKIFLDESRTDSIMAEKMDCSVHRTKKGITIGFKIGNILFGIGPEISFGGEHQIIWERHVQDIIVRYKELCSRFNTGVMTKKEYNERLKEIDAVAKEVMEFQEKVIQRIKAESQGAFKELDNETAKRGFSDKEIKAHIEEIGLKIKKLPPITQKDGIFDVGFSNDVKIVVAEGTAVMGDDTTAASVKTIALNNARRKAIEEAVGVTIHGSSVLYNSELISDLVVAATKGLIVKERILEGSGFKEEGSTVVYKVLLEAHVKPVRLQRNGEFKIVKAEVFKPSNPLSVNQPVFHDNDELQIKVKTSMDAHINIFSIDQYGMVSQLFPNHYVEEVVVSGDKEYIFPDEQIRALGVRLRAKAPKNLNNGIESILIIATKERVNLFEPSGDKEAVITDLMSKLSEITPLSWAEKTIGYEVRR